MLTLTSPVEIWAHRLPAGLKLAALCAITMVLFALPTPALTLAAAAMAAIIASGGARFARQSAATLRPLIPFMVIVALWHLWLHDPSGIKILLTMITAVAAANFVTMTTRLSDMIQVVETLTKPLTRIGLSPRSLALAIALTIRFIPTLTVRTTQIAEAWRARSTRRPGWRILLPITLATFDDAERVAEALRARGGAG